MSMSGNKSPIPAVKTAGGNMDMRTRSLMTVITGAIVLVLLGICHSGAFGYPCNVFNIKQLLTYSEVTAKIQVLATKIEGTCLDPRFQSTDPQCIAHVKCLMSIKGTVADEFDIAFPTEKMAMATYPELVKDEVCLVFLNGKTSPYHFLDLDNATMQLGAESITMQPKQTPEERLIAELLAYAKLAQGTDRVAAIAALGQLAAKDALAQLNAAGDKHQDLVEYAQSLIARVQANDAPSSNELLAFFRRDDKEYDDGAAIKKYGSTGYSLLNLHIKLLMAVCNSVKTDPRQANAQVTKLANFPYVDFFHQVLQKDFVKHYENGGLFIGQALRNLTIDKAYPCSSNCSMPRISTCATVPSPRSRASTRSTTCFLRQTFFARMNTST